MQILFSHMGTRGVGAMVVRLAAAAAFTTHCSTSFDDKNGNCNRRSYRIYPMDMEERADAKRCDSQKAG